MSTRNLDPSITEKWESREYGSSDEFVAVVDESESTALDSALAMKLVSIRLPISLIETLKAIAGHHGVAYQPMIRDLLTRFARSEIRQIVNELDGQMREAQSVDEASAPVEAFIERERRRVCA